MKKKILIPTDFSKNAWNAITYAADLFESEECTFYLLNVYGTTGYTLGDLMVPEPGTKSYDDAATISQKGLEKVLELLKLREPNYKHTYKTISEFNEPLIAMKECVDEYDITMIIMGTKGASNKRGVLFGSNTITAMEKIRNCPVLGIPKEARIASVKEIVMPTSYKTHYKSKELSVLRTIAQLQDATICVLHVNPTEELTNEQQEKKVLLSECLEHTKYRFHHLSGVDATIGVRNFVESRDSDMVAIINRKHAFFGSVFTAPMVKELGMFSKVPLLVMHDLRN